MLTPLIKALILTLIPFFVGRFAKQKEYEYKASIKEPMLFDNIVYTKNNELTEFLAQKVDMGIFTKTLEFYWRKHHGISNKNRKS